jgi:hypothetical protein
MVLGQPNVIKSVVLAPSDLIKNFSVEPVRGLAPLRWISEVIPKTETYFATVLIHGLQLLTTFLRTPDVTLSEALV